MIFFDMRKKIAIISLFGTMLLGMTLGLYGFAAAGEVAPSAEEQLLLDLINAARKDPLGVAESMGMNRDPILEALPGLEDILIHGLPPLAFSEKLYSAASLHTADMFANSFFRSESPDGRTPKDRITGVGYPALTTGESLGMLGFNNFVDPENAVSVIFNKMFRDELDPSKKTKRNILDPELREAGISIDSGPFHQGGALWNAYLVTCDFASPFDLFAVERGLWRFINEARRSPLQALEKAGIDEAAAREVLGDHASVLDIGLAPLAWNPRLFESALRHNHDMIARHYYDSVSPDGTTPAERIESAGYDLGAPYTGETLGFLLLEESESPEGAEEFEESVDPFEAARLIFEAMLTEELDPESEMPLNIFNSIATEVGIAVLRMPLDPGDPSTDMLYTAVADFARPEAPRSYLLGNVFHDVDLDGVFSLDEGAAGLRVVLQHFEGIELTEVESGPFGDYQLEVPASGFLQLAVENDTGGVEETRLLFWWQNMNRLIDMPIPIQVDETKDDGAKFPAPSPPSLSITW
jgi:uncharacterized protein YkwD